MTRSACLVCFRDKKKCDMERPCGRCVLGFKDCVERDAVVVTRPKGIRYTNRACIACNRSKVRCSVARPCMRCMRLGFECRDVPYKSSPPTSPSSQLTTQLMSFRPSNEVSPYGARSQLPVPDLDNIFLVISDFLTTMSPFLLTDLLTGPEMFFRSSLTCTMSVFPEYRKREFLTRLLELASLDVYAPERTPLAALRIESYLEDSDLHTPRLKEAQLKNKLGVEVKDVAFIDDDRDIIQYYLYRHKFVSFPECIAEGMRPGVLINFFLDPDEDGTNLLFGALNPEAEIYTGYTTEEYNSFQNIIAPRFSAFDAFPEVLRIYHRDDVHHVMTKGLLSYLSPGVEIPYEARLVHSNGHFVHVKCAHITIVKPNGQIKAVATALQPIPFL